MATARSRRARKRWRRLRLVLDGHLYLPPLLLDLCQDPVLPASPGPLTPWQRELLILLARGLPNSSFSKQQARHDAEKFVAAPFVLLAPPALGMLGDYTLSAGVVDVGDIAPELAKSLPRHPQAARYPDRASGG